jgi:hypothetical protein
LLTTFDCAVLSIPTRLLWIMTGMTLLNLVLAKDNSDLSAMLCPSAAIFVIY